MITLIHFEEDLNAECTFENRTLKRFKSNKGCAKYVFDLCNKVPSRIVGLGYDNVFDDDGSIEDFIKDGEGSNREEVIVNLLVKELENDNGFTFMRVGDEDRSEGYRNLYITACVEGKDNKRKKK